jgi:hypothetical protein
MTKQADTGRAPGLRINPPGHFRRDAAALDRMRINRHADHAQQIAILLGHEERPVRPGHEDLGNLSQAFFRRWPQRVVVDRFLPKLDAHLDDGWQVVWGGVTDDHVSLSL